MTRGNGGRRRSWLQDVYWMQAMVLFGIGAAVFMLWGTPFVYPLKILVVFFHEMSHGIAALLTGGSVVEIQVNAFQGGLCVTQGGNRFAILSAGYLGSLIWGGAILLWAAQTHHHGGITAALGIALIAVSLWLVRPVVGFGFAFGVLSGVALLICGLRVSPAINAIILKAVGLTSCMYAVLDIKSDIFMRPDSYSDAHMLYELTGVPTIVWGLLWVALALPASFYFVAAACRKKPRPRPRLVNPSAG